MSHMPNGSQPVPINTVTNADSVALPIGTPVYASGNGLVKRAIATAQASATVLGIVDQTESISASGNIGDSGTIGGTGEFVTATTAQWDTVAGTTGGLVFGTRYYVSTVAGKLTNTAPIGVGQYVSPVLVGVSTTVGMILIGVPSVVGAASSITGSGSANSVTKYTAASTLSNSLITDDGTSITLPNLTMPYTDIGTLAAGNNDLDLSAVNTVGIKFTPNIAGSIIRSIKPSGNPASTAKGEMKILFNAGNSALPGDYIASLAQDDGTGTYQHIHLGGRQPWHTIPALETCILRYDDATLKWCVVGPLDFQCHPRPIPITPTTMANTNVNDYAPTDSTTGLNGRYAQWWRCIPQASTRLCGIEASAPTGGSNWSRRILLTNYGAACVIAHGNSSGGTSTYAMYCPGAADFTWRFLASVWVCFDEANHIWIVEGP